MTVGIGPAEIGQRIGRIDPQGLIEVLDCPDVSSKPHIGDAAVVESRGELWLQGDRFVVIPNGALGFAHPLAQQAAVDMGHGGPWNELHGSIEILDRVTIFAHLSMGETATVVGFGQVTRRAESRTDYTCTDQHLTGAILLFRAIFQSDVFCWRSYHHAHSQHDGKGGNLDHRSPSLPNLPRKRNLACRTATWIARRSKNVLLQRGM